MRAIVQISRNSLLNKLRLELRIDHSNRLVLRGFSA